MQPDGTSRRALRLHRPSRWSAASAAGRALVTAAVAVTAVLMLPTLAAADVLPPAFEVVHSGGNGAGALFASVFNDTDILFKVSDVGALPGVPHFNATGDESVNSTCAEQCMLSQSCTSIFLYRRTSGGSAEEPTEALECIGLSGATDAADFPCPRSWAVCSSFLFVRNSQSPTSLAPTTPAPTTAAPTTTLTFAPVTFAPTTVAPATAAPTASGFVGVQTPSPVTFAPSSAAPTTLAPTTTHTFSPTTPSPTTLTPTTGVPTTAAPTAIPTAQPTSAPVVATGSTGKSSSGVVNELGWYLAAAVAVLLLVILFIERRKIMAYCGRSRDNKKAPTSPRPSSEGVGWDVITARTGGESAYSYADPDSSPSAASPAPAPRDTVLYHYADPEELDEDEWLDVPSGSRGASGAPVQYDLMDADARAARGRGRTTRESEETAYDIAESEGLGSGRYRPSEGSYDMAGSEGLDAVRRRTSARSAAYELAGPEPPSREGSRAPRRQRSRRRDGDRSGRGDYDLAGPSSSDSDRDTRGAVRHRSTESAYSLAGPNPMSPVYGASPSPTGGVYELANPSPGETDTDADVFPFSHKDASATRAAQDYSLADPETDTTPFARRTRSGGSAVYELADAAPGETDTDRDMRMPRGSLVANEWSEDEDPLPPTPLDNTSLGDLGRTDRQEQQQRDSAWLVTPSPRGPSRSQRAEASVETPSSYAYADESSI